MRLKEALCSISYGMYIVATEDNGSLNGQIVNVGGQLTANPPKFGICLSKKNLTCEMLRKSKKFSLSVLADNTPMLFIGKFGFRTGRDINKFTNTEYFISEKTNIPVVTEYCISYLEGKVEKEIEIDSHIFFIAGIVNADILSAAKPLTYAYYHDIKGGKTAKNAPTYIEETETNKETKGGKMKKFKCTVCEYIYDPEKGDPEHNIKPGTAFEDVPDDWTCPVCGVGKDQFEEINE